jgi:hypothetical protein
MRFSLLEAKDGSFLLCVKIPVRERLKLFIIDTGNVYSYIYFAPFGSAIIRGETMEVLQGSEGKGHTFVKLLFDGVPFWHSLAKPYALRGYEQTFKCTIDGVLGMDYLVSEKINLDFSKLL